MKKLIFALIAFLGILSLSTGCKKDKIFGGLSVDIPAADITMPALNNPILMTIVPLHTPTVLPIPIEQAFNLDDTMRKHTNGDFGASDVKSVVIKKITIDVLNPGDSSNLSNFESAILYLSSNANRSDSIQVAVLNFDNTSYSNAVYETSNGAEIRPYLNGDTLIYKIKASLREYTNQSMDLSIKAVVQAK